MSKPDIHTGLLDTAWVETQAKVFSRWCSAKLEPRSITVTDIRTDFADGVKLLHLLEVTGGKPVVARWHRTVTGVRARFLALENIQFALNHIQTVLGIKLHGIMPEQIADKNEKMTLGLIWHLIRHFLSAVSFEDGGGGSGQAGKAKTGSHSGVAPLLAWVQKKLSGVAGVNVLDTTKSWSSGAAFCALLGVSRPNLLDLSTIDLLSENKAVQLANLTRAFTIMRELGVKLYLDPEDVIGPLDAPFYVPDEKSIWTQIAELHRFFGSDSVTASQLESGVRDYESSLRAVLEAVDQVLGFVNNTTYARTILGIREQLATVQTIDREDQKTVRDLRARAEGMWSALVSHASVAGLPPPERPAGLEPETVDPKFVALEEALRRRTKELTDELYAAECELLEAFNRRCVTVLRRSGELRTQGEPLTGATPEELNQLRELRDTARQLRQESESLKAPGQELVDLGLSDRIKHTPIGVQHKVGRVKTMIKEKLRQAEGRADDEKRRRVWQYSSQAVPLLQEAEEIDDAVIQSDSSGDLASRLAALEQKHKDITVKREVAKRLLVPLFQDLQQASLEHQVEVPPERIDAAYAALLGRIDDDLNSLREEQEAKSRSQSQIVLRSVDPVIERLRTPRTWVIPRRTKIPCIVEKTQRKKTKTSFFKTKEVRWEENIVVNPLDGIIAFMTRQTGGNLHDAGIVLVTSSPPIRPDERAAAKNVLDLVKDTIFCSAHKRASDDIPNEPNNWICYDFQDLQIIPTQYTIRSCFGGVNGFNPKNWVIETSVDSKKWVQADVREGNTKLNGFNVTRTFNVTGRQQCRYIRLVNIGRNHNGNDALSIASFEIFGYLIDLSVPPAPE
jgi:actinin alpha